MRYLSLGIAALIGVTGTASAGGQKPPETAPKPRVVDKPSESKPPETKSIAVAPEKAVDLKLRGDIVVYPVSGLTVGEGPEALARMVAKYVRPGAFRFLRGSRGRAEAVGAGGAAVPTGARPVARPATVLAQVRRSQLEHRLRAPL